MNIFVIIVTYNGMKWIDKCINSVLKSTLSAKIILIDNGSTDGTLEYLSNNFPQAIILPNQKNLGFGKANNLGIEYALSHNCDYVYLLNQDAWIEENTLEILVKTLNKHKDFGIISPIQITASKKNIDKNFAKYCSKEHCKNIFDDFILHKEIQDIYEIDFVMAAHWLIARKCLEKVGGFNPSFPHYGEDDNYLQRLKFHNIKFGISPFAFGVHDREYRELSKNKIIHMNYIEYIKIASNITTKASHKAKKIFRNFLTSFNLCLKFFTLKPFGLFFSFLFNLKKIKMNNKISINSDFAFLNLN